MRSFSAPLFLAAALALLAAAPGALAHPGHGDVLPLAARQGTLNGTSVGTAGNSSTADDHVPDFKTDCVCPEPICDSRLNAASVRFLLVFIFGIISGFF